MKKFTTCLWFDNQAEEAANYYVSIFKNSKIGTVARYGEAGPGSPGSVMTVSFELDGQQFMGLNGGPLFSFSEAISIVVNCETQAEIDEMWQKLSAGGEEGQCGWLKDKYGLSWQIVPVALMEEMESGDPVKTNRVMQAVLQMRKLDIATLQKAYEGA